jgi:hypothetical protein
MTALQHLVLESVHRLDVADSDKIREYVGQMMGHEVVDERVSATLENLLEKELVSCSENASGNKVVRSYRLTSGGDLFFSATTQ